MEIEDVKIGMSVSADLSKYRNIPKVYRKPDLKVKIVEIIKGDLVYVEVAKRKEMVMIQNLTPLNVGQKAIQSATEILHKSFRLRDTVRGEE
jgi:hypothetical protein